MILNIRNRQKLTITLLSTALLLSLLLGISQGSVSLPIKTIVATFTYPLSHNSFSFKEPTIEAIILIDIRLPRVIAAALVGASLAASGVLFQGLLRNPMADPYFLGTSAGAALGATLALSITGVTTFFGWGLIPTFAFAGAIATVTAVYLLATIDGTTPVIRLILTGFVVSAVLMATVTLLIVLNSTLQLNIRHLVAFLFGGFGTNNWSQILTLMPIIFICLSYSVATSNILNAFSLGEEAAYNLGVNIRHHKALIIIVASLLTSSAVSLSGLIGFIGLMAPHAARIAIGPDHRQLTIAASIAGATFMVLADLIARIALAPTEIPVGVITALLGAPLLLYLLRNRANAYEF
jgi:iron complex transport system permease protein